MSSVGCWPISGGQIGKDVRRIMSRQIFSWFRLTSLYAALALGCFVTHPAASVESLAAFGAPSAAAALGTPFDGRCIPAGCVAPRSHTPGIFGRRALPAGRLAHLGATPDFHHGLLTAGTKMTARGRGHVQGRSPDRPARRNGPKSL